MVLYRGKVSESALVGRRKEDCYNSLGLLEVIGVKKREWRSQLVAKWNFKSKVTE